MSDAPDWRVRRTELDMPGLLRPDGRVWITERATTDGRGFDLFELAPDGTERRLTNAPGDDTGPSWSPDGRLVVFSTTRGNAAGRRDLALLDVRSGAIRRLTSGGSDFAAAWSPDGSRIAFLRGDENSETLCVIDADGGEPRCRAPEPGTRSGIRGWIDARSLVVGYGAGDRRWFARVNVDSGIETPLPLEGSFAVVSPDGRWIVCRCTRPGYPANSWMVVRLDDPSDVRLLRIAGSDPDHVYFTWGPGTPRPPWVARLVAHAGPGAPLVAVAHQLRAAAEDSAGRAVDVGTVTWRSLDTTIATVDEAGRLLGRRTGRVRVEASAGGWRRTEVAMIVEAPREAVVLEEQWRGALRPAWVPYGDPQPAIVRDTLFATAFHNRGDTNYFSGAYTAAAFDTRGGLRVDAELSMPLAGRGGWREQLVALFSVADSVRMTRWDHRTGDGPPGGGPGCRLHLPHGTSGDSLLIEEWMNARALPMPPQVRTGRPFRATVQVFPDGRCGYAIDGRAIWVGPPGFDGRPARVKLEGRSVGVRNLIGAVRVSSGVAADVAWDALGRTPARPSAAAER